MRLIVPIDYYVKGGVERVIVSLLTQLSREEEVEKIIIAIPPQEKSLPQLIGPSPKIVYVSLEWEIDSFPSKISKLVNRLIPITRRLHNSSLEKWLQKWNKEIQQDKRIQYLINKYYATHCLYVFTNRRPLPPIDKIPIGMIAHDLYWQYSPMTYTPEYQSVYNRSLQEWMKKVKIVLAVSQKTRGDILTLFPQFNNKIKSVPHSGFPIDIPSGDFIVNKPEIPTFYFPSSFGIYKDQLTLLKASIHLIKQGYNFRLVFTGRETDQMIAGKLKLSQQSATKEYGVYLQECQQLYVDNQEIFREYFAGLGYCSNQMVEQCYENSSCVIMCSQYEGFGLAVAEAIVRGIPVIASDLQVFQEQVELYHADDRVTFFCMGDFMSLAERMVTFLNHPIPKLSSMEAQQRFSHWTWKNVAQQYIKFLQ